MPLVLLAVLPPVITLCLLAALGRRFPAPILAAWVAFSISAVLVSLYVASEWRDSYGFAKLGEAVLAVLLISLLVALAHWGAWSIGSRLWSRVRGPASGESRTRN